MKINPLILKPLLIIGIPIVIVSVYLSLSAHSQKNIWRSNCALNLKEIGVSFAQYTRDYDAHLPLVKATTFVPPKNNRSMGTGDYGWVDELQPYVKGLTHFRCPAHNAFLSTRADSSGYTSYWMNGQLDGARRFGAAHLILIGDGLSSDARSALSAPPDRKGVCDGYDGACQSAWRHFGGANFGFLDGHVKWLRPEEVSATKGAPATFAP